MSTTTAPGPPAPRHLGSRRRAACSPSHSELTFSRATDNGRYYFRKSFLYTAGPQPKISIKVRVDDACAIYINGTEILPRQNLPTTGSILYDTPAIAGVEATAYVTLQVPDGTLISGQMNTIAVEVHQNANTSSDAVFAFQLLETVAVGGTASTPYIESLEEWVELYNRSSRTIDLAGWQLGGGVGFTFPPGSSLAPEGYIVVTRDVPAFQTAHPGVPAVGPFSSHLSHRGELLELKDAMGSVVDSVFYRDSKPWPHFADSGGCSLELRNPHADNSVPEAWASSDETTRSSWQNYSFTARAIQPVYSPNIFNFHEFRLGLLENGEVLIDDISVIEDPSGTNRQLLQNGRSRQARPTNGASSGITKPLRSSPTTATRASSWWPKGRCSTCTICLKPP